MKKWMSVILMGLALLSLSACGEKDDSAEGEAVTPADCVHEYTAAVTLEATCGMAGTRNLYCATCGESRTEEIPATGKHSYQNVVITEPTCAKPGMWELKCAFCSHSYPLTVQATGKHSYIDAVTKEPTCVEKGERTFTCSTCEDSYTQDIEVTEHFYTEKTEREAGCNTEGTQVCTCKICGHAYTKSIPITGKHHYTGKVTRKETCTLNGEITYTCTECGKEYVEEISAGHQWKEATCTDAQTCIVCGLSEGASLGHILDGAYCARCGKTDSQNDRLINEEKQRKVDELAKALMSHESMSPASMPLDVFMIQDLYGMPANTYEAYAVHIPMMMVHATEFAIFWAVEEKLDVVLEKIEARQDSLVVTWQNYLPAQYDMVQNYRILVNGNLVVFLICRDIDEISQDIAEVMGTGTEFREKR